MTDINAFEAVTIEHRPSTTFYKGGTYRSDREYVDAAGDRWVYVGIYDGDPLWRRGSEPACWNLNTVIDQFGPLTEASEPAARLAEISARTQAATPGPWCTDAWEIYQGTEYQPGISQWIGETCRGTSSPEQDRADAAFVAAARADVPWLLAELNKAKAEAIELKAQLDTAERQTAELEQRLTSIRHLHKDSPMGPCPVCLDGDAQAAGGDGLISYPCPTARLAGATDCEPKGAAA